MNNQGIDIDNIICYNINMTNKSTQLQQNKLMQDMGFDEQEMAIYLALLDNGAMLPQHIAQKTGIKRTTLYSLFPELLQKGIITEVRQGKRRLFSPVSPDLLFEKYEARYKELKQNLGELATLYRMQGLKPTMQIFEGTEEVKKLYMDTLKYKGEMLIYNRVTKYREDILKWLVEFYVPERVKLGLTVRAIVNRDEASLQHMASGKEFARVTRFVPQDKFPFRIEVMIYGDKISFFTCEKGGPQFGMIIESKVIAETQRSLFDLAWEGAKKYNQE